MSTYHEEPPEEPYSNSVLFVSNVGKDWLSKYCVIKKTRRRVVEDHQLEDNSWTNNPYDETFFNTVVSEDSKLKVIGMGDAVLYTLRYYTTLHDAIVEEYIQHEYAKDGVYVAFLALRFKDTKEPIRQSLYSKVIITSELRRKKQYQ